MFPYINLQNSENVQFCVHFFMTSQMIIACAYRLSVGYINIKPSGFTRLTCNIKTAPRIFKNNSTLFKGLHVIMPTFLSNKYIIMHGKLIVLSGLVGRCNIQFVFIFEKKSSIYKYKKTIKFLTKNIRILTKYSISSCIYYR